MNSEDFDNDPFFEHLEESEPFLAKVLRTCEFKDEDDTRRIKAVPAVAKYIRTKTEVIEQALYECSGCHIRVEIEELSEPPDSDDGLEPLTGDNSNNNEIEEIPVATSQPKSHDQVEQQAERHASDTTKKPSASPENASRSSAPKAAATTNHVRPVQPNRAARRRTQHDLAKIEQTLHRSCRNGDIVEIRALKVAPRGITVAGYFDADHLAEAARLLTNNNRDAAGIYITLNPPKRDLLARAENRLVERPDFSATSDGDIDRREWLFIDFDPKRPSGISATDAEKAAAPNAPKNAGSISPSSRGWLRWSPTAVTAHTCSIRSRSQTTVRAGFSSSGCSSR